MPSISYDSYTTWTNYHLTTGTLNPPDLEPCVKVEDMGRIHTDDVAMMPGLERFTATAGTLVGHMGHVVEQIVRKQMNEELGDPEKPFPATTVGRGWSFSRIIGADQHRKRESMLMCDGLAGSVMVSANDLHSAAAGMAGTVAMTGGGTRLRELAEWAHAVGGLTIKTSGTHLGATVAGAFATASHGSRLGFGGIQDMVLGMHLVTGLDLATGIGDTVWLERASRPVLSDAAARKLDPFGGKHIRIIRNDEQFEDALVHLGCMGVVNCVAMELVQEVPIEVFRVVKLVDNAWLGMAAAGEWNAIANWLGLAGEPIFYEVTLDPHHWDGPAALHTMYFEVPSAGKAGKPPSPVSPADVVTRFAEGLSAARSASHNQAILKQAPEIDGGKDADLETHDLAPLPARMHVFDSRTNATSVFEYYLQISHFDPNEQPQCGTWREIHKDEITGAYPGSLYNCSYAIERKNLASAIPAICGAVANLPASFVFTVRFVDNPGGTIAFTRFKENAVIEIDGLSPWICRKKLHHLAHDADYKRNRKMLKYLEFTLPQGQRAVARALDEARIDYSNHWGKRGFIDADKVQTDFGPLPKPDSKLARWRRTRDVLLSTALGKAVFWNWGAVNMGLLERPMDLPPDLPKP